MRGPGSALPRAGRRSQAPRDGALRLHDVPRRPREQFRQPRARFPPPRVHARHAAHLVGGHARRRLRARHALFRRRPEPRVRHRARVLGPGGRRLGHVGLDVWRRRGPGARDAARLDGSFACDHPAHAACAAGAVGPGGRGGDDGRYALPDRAAGARGHGGQRPFARLGQEDPLAGPGPRGQGRPRARDPLELDGRLPLHEAPDAAARAWSTSPTSATTWA